MGVRKIIAALAAPAVLLAFPGAAAAADEESLTGFYIGLNAGYGTGSKDWLGPPNPAPLPPFSSANVADHSANGLVIGGSLGGRWQTGYVVLGVEAEGAWTDFSDSSANTSFPGFTNRTEVDWLATVTAQAGIASGGVHGYAEIGAAFARDRYSIIDSNGVAPDESDRVSDTRGGVVIGVGLELPMSGGWSARGEYNYINFGRSEYAISGDLWQIDQTMHVFRVGVLYRFGG